MLAENVYDLAPDDLYLRLRGMGRLNRCYLKIEGLNPAGSIKHKAALSMVSEAERTLGDLTHRHIIESSSGNLGIALAIICAAKGYRFTCVTDENANPAALAMMRALGATVSVISERDGNGGYLGSRIAFVLARCRQDPSYLWLNQYDNQANVRAHEMSAIGSILRTFPRVDHLFVGVGTGGTLMGCVQAVRRHSPGTQVVAVDAAGSVTFGSPPARRHIPGLGSSRRPELVDVDCPDVIVHVPESHAVRECRWLAATGGLLAGGSTGTVLAAVRLMLPHLREDALVVAISPDLGERYLGTLYNDTWVDAYAADPERQSAEISYPKGGRVDAFV